MLGRHDGVDYRGEVVDVGQGLDAQDYVVEGAFSALGSFFGRPDNWQKKQHQVSGARPRGEERAGRGRGGGDIPWRGLNRSFPYTGDAVVFGAIGSGLAGPAAGRGGRALPLT